LLTNLPSFYLAFAPLPCTYRLLSQITPLPKSPSLRSPCRTAFPQSRQLPCKSGPFFILLAFFSACGSSFGFSVPEHLLCVWVFCCDVAKSIRSALASSRDLLSFRQVPVDSQQEGPGSLNPRSMRVRSCVYFSCRTIPSLEHLGAACVRRTGQRGSASSNPFLRLFSLYFPLLLLERCRSSRHRVRRISTAAAPPVTLCYSAWRRPRDLHPLSFPRRRRLSNAFSAPVGALRLLALVTFLEFTFLPFSVRFPFRGLLLGLFSFSCP